MTQGSNKSREEQVAVRTTIVGGRPPGSGRDHGDIPRGFEVLVKKAAVDAAFREELLEHRSDAAGLIDLELTPAEQMMINTAPVEHLARVVAATRVPDQHRATFLGTAAALMLAAIGVGVAGCSDSVPVTEGVRPDDPTKPSVVTNSPETVVPTENIPVTDGIRPDQPASRGIRPDRPASKGIRPDVPTVPGDE